VTFGIQFITLLLNSIRILFAVDLDL